MCYCSVKAKNFTNAVTTFITSINFANNAIIINIDITATVSNANVAPEGLVGDRKIVAYLGS